MKDWESNASSFEVLTSGTTGIPKKIIIEKSFAISSAESTLDFLNITEGQNALLCMNPSTIAGKMMIVRSIVGDLNLYIVEPKMNVDIPGETIHFSAMVPLQVENSISNPHFSKIQKLIIGGAVINNQLWTEIHQSNIEAYQTFGSTETVSHIAMRKIEREKSTYKTLPGIEIETNDVNQLIINAPKIGVHKLITNDIINRINHREFEWLGRKDFIINSGGVKLNPEEIETKLNPIIKECFFITSAPDETLGEKVVLVIEGEKNNYSKNDLRTVLSKYQTPKNIILSSKFSLTPSGKINKKETLKNIINKDGQVL